MPKKSAGILLFRLNNQVLEVFLVHPGGPFFKNKDLGAWSIPKGEIDDNEDPLAAAIREFYEETGVRLSGNFIPLTPIKQKGGKTILPWAIKGDIEETQIKSNTFQMEWPPKSGKLKEFPEIDEGQWFSISAAKEKINPAQAALIEELEARQGADGSLASERGA